mmetsp:Transcript_13021/g.29769  ORF Transcript_13021/g.29769 Transcript_13021/m.29769 type:complete len:80 (+) Transcript_13021:3-242(+)
MNGASGGSAAGGSALRWKNDGEHQLGHIHSQPALSGRSSKSQYALSTVYSEGSEAATVGTEPSEGQNQNGPVRKSLTVI